jgi:hypothetical protein
MNTLSVGQLKICDRIFVVLTIFVVLCCGYFGNRDIVESPNVVSNNLMHIARDVGNVPEGMPTIRLQPAQYTAVAIGTKLQLSVQVDIQYEGLVYQWYSNDTVVPVNAKPIQDANKSILYVPTDVEGTKYYYVLIVNSVDNIQYVAQSNVSTVVVGKVAQLPVITRNPGSMTRYPNERLVLSVEASVSVGKLEYQWYQNNKHSNQGGTKLDATNSIIEATFAKSGVYYLYVEITNIDNINVNSTTTSQVAVILVKDNPTQDEVESFWDKYGYTLPYIAMFVLSIGVMGFGLVLLRNNKNKR